LDGGANLQGPPPLSNLGTKTWSCMEVEKETRPHGGGELLHRPGPTGLLLFTAVGEFGARGGVEISSASKGGDSGVYVLGVARQSHGDNDVWGSEKTP